MAYNRNPRKTIAGSTARTVESGRVSKAQPALRKFVNKYGIVPCRKPAESRTRSYPTAQPGASKCCPIIVDSDDEGTAGTDKVNKHLVSAPSSRLPPTRMTKPSTLQNFNLLRNLSFTTRNKRLHAGESPIHAPTPCGIRLSVPESNVRTPTSYALRALSAQPPKELPSKDTRASYSIKYGIGSDQTKRNDGLNRICYSEQPRTEIRNLKEHASPIKDEDDKIMVKIDPNDPAFQLDIGAPEDLEDYRRPTRKRKNSIDRDFLVPDDGVFGDSDYSYINSSSKDSDSENESDPSDVEMNTFDEERDTDMDLRIDMRPKHAFNAHLFGSATCSKGILSQRVSRIKKL